MGCLLHVAVGEKNLMIVGRSDQLQNGQGCFLKCRLTQWTEPQPGQFRDVSAQATRTY